MHLSNEARTLHHSRLAWALEQAGDGDGHPRALVRHLEAAGQPERAAHQALRAAAMAQEALAFDQAAEFLAIALRIGPGDPDQQRSLRIRLAEALVNAGRSAEAAEVFAKAAEGDALDVRLECQRKAAEQFLISGHTERGREALAAVLAEFGVGLPKTPTRALASILWNRLRIKLRGVRWKDRDEAEIAQRELTRLDIHRAAALGLGMVDTIRGADFQTRDLLLALRLGERRRVVRSIAYEASYIGSQGGRSLPRARRLVERADRLAQASRDPYLLGWTKGAEGVIQYFEGSFRTAATTLAENVVRLRDQTIGTNWEVSTMRIFHLFALRQIGSPRELRRWFDEYTRDAVRRGDRYSETTMLRSCNIVHLMEDLPAEARGALARTTWTPPEGGYHLQHWYALRALREIDLYETQEGRADGALEHSLPELDALERSLLTRVQFVRAESRWLRGRLLLAQGETARVKPIARALERERTAYASAWARLLAAAVAAREGDVEGAGQLLKSAFYFAKDCDMLLLPAVAMRRLGQLTDTSEGRALQEETDAWMVEQGIRNPARMASVIAPGFPLATPRHS
jgi:tetratricopeptide (TPR) repeat protein